MTTTTFATSVISSDDDPIFTYAASGDGLIVNAGVTLSNVGGDVVAAPAGLTGFFATINGTLSTPGDGSGAVIDAYRSAIDVTVGSTGRLESAESSGIATGSDSSVANHGTIHVDELDGVVMHAGGSEIENWGTIIGGRSAIRFTSDDLTGSGRVVNHGTLKAAPEANSGEAEYSSAVSFAAGSLDLVNDGTIHGRVYAGVYVLGSSWEATDVSTIENSGTIRADAGFGIVASKATIELTNTGTISGARGSLSLAAGADTITNDGVLVGTARLGAGDDVYHGEHGRVAGDVWGQAGDDLLIGGAKADVLAGGTGDDTLLGGSGADTLTGASGADRLAGGFGDDVFRFAAVGDATGDTLVGADGARAFGGAGTPIGDRIDVSAIDANTSLAGHQDFVFGTSHAIGHLWAVDVGNVTHIRGNVSGDATPEFDLAINDGAGVHASDYASVDFIL